MPGMVLFGRRWAIASDDLVFPGFFELVVRVLWWIGILTLYLMHRGKLDCAGGALLSSYLIVLMILLAVVICTVSAIMCVSMRGTICNPGPRKSMSKLLYIRLALFFPEMVWASLGAAWVADGVQCDRTVVNGIIATVVVSWIIIAATVVSIIIVFDPLGGKMAPYSSAGPSHLDSHDSSQLLNGLKTAATSVWETRIKLLCCCIGKDDHTRVAFSSTAELFSTYFSDTDLVPSDIAAGLALLHQQQDNIRNNQEPAQVVSHAPGSSQEADLDAELENCHHYMQFAAAAYGWPLYIYRNPLTGLCRIGGDCCRSRTTDYDLVGGDQLNCHFGSILHTTGLQYRDFIHVSFHDKRGQPQTLGKPHRCPGAGSEPRFHPGRQSKTVSQEKKPAVCGCSAVCPVCLGVSPGGSHLHSRGGLLVPTDGSHTSLPKRTSGGAFNTAEVQAAPWVYELPFIVALDHRKESVVVAVRGTMSLQDVLTDLSAESEVLDVECEVQDRLAHKGISQAARYVYRRLINDGILSQAFSIAPEYRLVIVGHSLGGGAAALLATMLRAAYPQVRCYAFSPPRGLWSKALHEYSQSFIVSLVLGKDVIPRLSVTNLEDLKRRILRVVAHCNKPKYKILLHGLWYELFGGNPNFPTELDGGDQEVLTQPLLGEQSLLTRWSPAYSFSSDSPLDSSPKYPPLYPPGRIIHLQEEGASGRFGCCSAAQYSAKWSHEAEFSKILIGPKMLTDHMPDIVMRALDSLVSDRAACVSCPAQGVSGVDVA
ncbi:sn1-specific diacylglycerol lipase beta isoform X2 [Piliocolobus tephrosceles]|uniref:Diacylglycerol lipase-beta n=1 Tax=Piliocolobus tephrosceles TaxID=591936 RepID=A0A8C9LQ97_9PRIM|nr:sn1-specific diacylglycerol lipase beta isoform X2 [Piliocolobus tephrosceles]